MPPTPIWVLRLWDLSFEVWNLRFEVRGVFEIRGLRCLVWDLRFEVWGLSLICIVLYNPLNAQKMITLSCAPSLVEKLTSGQLSCTPSLVLWGWIGTQITIPSPPPLPSFLPPPSPSLEDFGGFWRIFEDFGGFSRILEDFHYFVSWDLWKSSKILENPRKSSKILQNPRKTPQVVLTSPASPSKILEVRGYL